MRVGQKRVMSFADVGEEVGDNRYCVLSFVLFEVTCTFGQRILDNRSFLSSYGCEILPRCEDFPNEKAEEQDLQIWLFDSHVISIGRQLIEEDN